MQIKTTMRYHLTPVRMVIINKSTSKCHQGCGEMGPFYTVGGNECRLVQSLCKTVWRYLKKLKMGLPFYQAITVLGIYPKKPKTLF